MPWKRYPPPADCRPSLFEPPEKGRVCGRQTDLLLFTTELISHHA